jgi:hypothetical protein
LSRGIKEDFKYKTKIEEIYNHLDFCELESQSEEEEQVEEEQEVDPSQPVAQDLTVPDIALLQAQLPNPPIVPNEDDEDDFDPGHPDDEIVYKEVPSVEEEEELPANTNDPIREVQQNEIAPISEVQEEAPVQTLPTQMVEIAPQVPLPDTSTNIIMSDPIPPSDEQQDNSPMIAPQTSPSREETNNESCSDLTDNRKRKSTSPSPIDIIDLTCESESENDDNSWLNESYFDMVGQSAKKAKVSSTKNHSSSKKGKVTTESASKSSFCDYIVGRDEHLNEVKRCFKITKSGHSYCPEHEPMVAEQTRKKNPRKSIRREVSSSRDPSDNFFTQYRHATPRGILTLAN